MKSVRPKFFRDRAAFRSWLERHHASEAELWVGLYKVASGKPSITWPELVDEALCFGWIDGIRKSIDEDAYMNRITPRKKGSIWSAVNTRRAQELIAAGRMTPAGARVFAERDLKKTNRYSFEQQHVELPPAYIRQFKRHKGAWAFFQAQPPSYRKPIMWWVTSAKLESTRQRRLDRLIAECKAGKRIEWMGASKRK